MASGRIHLHASPDVASIRSDLDPASWTGRPATTRRTQVESTLSSLLASPPAIALTASCTHGLEATARLLGIGPGDEVVVPAFAFPSTANAFIATGATIRFADVELETGNIDPRSVESLLGPRTAAVVALHYGGVAADVTVISKLCERSGASLVEDAAQSLFGSFDGTPLGRYGRVAAFSFHRTKNISAFEGGALVLNDSALVGPAQILLDKGTNRVEFETGLADAYEWCGFGSAWRMASPLVDLLGAQLAQASSIQQRRTEVWDRYWSALTGWAASTGCALPVIPHGATHPAHLFWLRLPQGADRDHFVAHCDRHDVEVARHYGSLPTSRHGRRIADPRDRCPNAAILASDLVRIPLHHHLSDPDVERVIDAVTTWRPGRVRHR